MVMMMMIKITLIIVKRMMMKMKDVGKMLNDAASFKSRVFVFADRDGNSRRGRER